MSQRAKQRIYDLRHRHTYSTYIHELASPESAIAPTEASRVPVLGPSAVPTLKTSSMCSGRQVERPLYVKQMQIFKGSCFVGGRVFDDNQALNYELVWNEDFSMTWKACLSSTTHEARALKRYSAFT